MVVCGGIAVGPVADAVHRTVVLINGDVLVLNVTVVVVIVDVAIVLLGVVGLCVSCDNVLPVIDIGMR